MKRPITIASGQFGDLSLEELCKLVSSIGYEGIEIACQAHINVHKVLEDDAYVAQFRATLEKYGLKVWALGAHLIGQCVGARDYGQASYYTKKLMKIAYLSVIGWNTLILATLPLSLKLYNLSEETIWLSTVLIVLHNGCAMLLWPAAFTLPNALRASNDVRFTMIVSIVSMLLFRILFSYVLGIWFQMGAIGVWIAMIIDWVCRSICFVGRFVRGKWKLQKI